MSAGVSCRSASKTFATPDAGSGKPAFITGSTFYSNSANLIGGGVRVRLTGRATIMNSNLVVNTATGPDGLTARLSRVVWRT